MCDVAQMFGLKAGDDQLAAAQKATLEAQTLAEQALADRKKAVDAANKAAAGDPEAQRLAEEAVQRQRVGDGGMGALFQPSSAPIGFKTAMGA